MATFIGTLVIFATVLTGLAVGVLLQGKRLQGSCGGTGLACSCSALAARNCPIRQRRRDETTHKP